MSAAIFDLVGNYAVERGALYTLPFTVVYEETDLPFDLTDYEGRGKIREDYDSVDVLASFSFNTFDASGVVTPTLGATVTELIPSGIDRAVYDIELAHKTDADNVIRAMKGRVEISPEVTH